MPINAHSWSPCCMVIQCLEGYMAQDLGDGLLVYFGYPQAHEDDAQRAVRDGFGLLEAVGALNVRLEREAGIRLAVRIGIHTGPVVIGEMGGGGRQKQLALGDTPNIASRIQGVGRTRYSGDERDDVPPRRRVLCLSGIGSTVPERHGPTGCGRASGPWRCSPPSPTLPSAPDTRSTCWSFSVWR